MRANRLSNNHPIPLLAAFLALAACSGSPKDGESSTPDGSSCATGDILLDVGFGDESYTALADGDTLQMVHGPQGGWHFETAGLVHHSEKEISILPTLTLADSGTLISTNSQPEFKALFGYDDASCEGTFFNTRAFVDDGAGPGDSQQNICALDGREADLTIEVQDIVSGRATSTTVRVLLAIDPIDLSEC